ncbi:amino acid permease 6-like [Nicotiana tabacum]|uniref:Amino acid permease 6-like n=1 Tax=Nicotiana tabacum TaxID=4097 RepID=A0AC58RVW6_TOBAC
MYVSTELESGDVKKKNFDDDGREKRTGTLLTASAHIITAVIGSGVLSLAWVIAQLGWVAGPAVLFAFSFITYFTSTLLADCYRSPGPISDKRNCTYMDVVHLGGVKVTLCGLAQYANFVGVTIRYTITTSISMVAVNRGCHSNPDFKLIGFRSLFF